MTTPAALEAPAGRRAAIDLAHIREQWGDLLAAIDEHPRTEWPPRDCRDFDRPQSDGPVIGRVPLTLREHPAPLNLDALSAAVEVERALFTTADHIAHQAQRPVHDRDDLLDPARWHPTTTAGPGSRRHGLHWCAVWLEGRALDEPEGDLFTVLDGETLRQLAHIAHRARRTIEHALARAGRRTVLDDPCPWCSGQLTAHTSGDPDTAVIVCGTGEPCPAPVVLSAGSRIWQRDDLGALYTALEKQRTKAGD